MASAVSSGTARTPSLTPSRRQTLRTALRTGSCIVYSAASSGAIRRDWRACSSYSFCHSDGPLDGEICTAVTLYSGQLVAQSENSVVMTLAWVEGWWKVV